MRKKPPKRDNAQILYDALKDIKFECKCCGRKQLIYANEDRVLCTWCGHYIYKSDELEFKYKIQNAIREREKNNG